MTVERSNDLRRAWRIPTASAIGRSRTAARAFARLLWASG